jgi:hypothetical protein
MSVTLLLLFCPYCVARHDLHVWLKYGGTEVVCTVEMQPPLHALTVIQASSQPSNDTTLVTLSTSHFGIVEIVGRSISVESVGRSISVESVGSSEPAETAAVSDVSSR